MPVIELKTIIQAPLERCFDLSRSIDLHLASTAQTKEIAVAGVTSGLIGLNKDVVWRAKHFGVWQSLTSRITAFERPRYFRDSMVRGAFKRFDHDHYFESQNGSTTMIDIFDFSAPLGFLGFLAEQLILTSYLRRFLESRNNFIKQTAESENWKQFLSK